VFRDNILGLSTYVSMPWRKTVATMLVVAVLLAVGCGGLVSHKVGPGDSLYSIGFYYGHDYRDIAEWNNIDAPYVIRDGQWLRVAPPDKRWFEEQKRQRQTSGKSIASPKNLSKKLSKKTRHESVVSRPVKIKKVPVAEDFTDKIGHINFWAWPAEGRLLNAGKAFSQRNKGIDIGGKRGQLVYATAQGKVVYGGSGLIGYGKLIIIKHNKTYLSAYAHNEKILVKEGDIVKRGQKIANMGRTPDNRIQLHFEIRRNGKPVDPLRFLKR